MFNVCVNLLFVLLSSFINLLGLLKTKIICIYNNYLFYHFSNDSIHCPGRSRNRWLDQLCRDNSIPPADLWRRAVTRGHSGTGVTLRSSTIIRVIRRPQIYTNKDCSLYTLRELVLPQCHSGRTAAFSPRTIITPDMWSEGWILICKRCKFFEKESATIPAT